MNLGCIVVLVLLALSALGMGWLIWYALSFLAAHGVPPGVVVTGAVFAFAMYSLYRARRDGML